MAKDMSNGRASERCGADFQFRAIVRTVNRLVRETYFRHISEFPIESLIALHYITGSILPEGLKTGPES